MIGIGIHLCDSAHSFECGQVHLGMPKVFPRLNLQYVKIELSYDSDFFHIGRHSYKQQTDSVISSSLAVKLLSFDPKFFCKLDCLILLHKISSEWLDFWTSFFARHFSIMTETN